MNPVRVLIVEDDYLVREMIRGILEENGYTVVGEAVNGHEAIQQTEALRPDVILMDLRMADMDGIEASHQISNCCPTPIVVLTAYEKPELVRQASEAGVGAYLVKPPNAREIERAIAIARARFRDLMALRALNAELERQNQELDAFAHTVAHDLKGQLSPLIGFAEMLTRNYARQLSPQGQRCATKVMHSAQKLNNIIDELLLLSTLRQTQVPSEPLEMEAIIQEAVYRLGFMIQEHQAQIVLSTDAWPIALGHAPWVEEVWINYISNGIKYGGKPEQGIPPRLELGFDLPAQPGDSGESASSDTPMVRFWIRDNGPGIPPEMHHKLFTPFNRIQTRAQGHGLGLSIVQRIIEKLNGQVGVESHPGQGSTFWFSLPLALP